MNSRDSIPSILPRRPERTSEFPVFFLFLIVCPTFAADGAIPGTSPTMWAMAGLVVAMLLDVAVLFLIIRDAMEDNANWLHGIGGALLWFGLALCTEGYRALARTLPTEEVMQRGADRDVWIFLGFRIVVYSAAPLLALLGLAVGRIYWKNYLDRKAAERSRLARGTLSRK